MLDKKTKKIIEDIYTLGGTELSLIIDAVKLRRNQLHTTDAQSLRPVSYTHLRAHETQ